jgi:hypothetical protein
LARDRKALAIALASDEARKACQSWAGSRFLENLEEALTVRRLRPLDKIGGEETGERIDLVPVLVVFVGERVFAPEIQTALVSGRSSGRLRCE